MKTLQKKGTKCTTMWELTLLARVVQQLQFGTKELKRERVGGMGMVPFVWSSSPNKIAIIGWYTHNPDESQRKNTWKTLNPLVHNFNNISGVFWIPHIKFKIVYCDDKSLSIYNCVVGRRRSINAGTKEWNPIQFNSIWFNSMTLSDDDNTSREKKEKKKEGKLNYNKHLKLLCANNQSIQLKNFQAHMSFIFTTRSRANGKASTSFTWNWVSDLVLNWAQRFYELEKRTCVKRGILGF